MQKVQRLLLYTPGRAHTVIAELGGFVGGVPALEDKIPPFGLVLQGIGSKPTLLDHATANRRGRLLVLARKVVRTQARGNLIQGGAIFAFRVQDVTFLPSVGDLSS